MLQESYKNKKNFSEAYNNLGSILRVRGKGSESISASAYKKALLLNSDFAEPQNNLGNVYMDTGNFQEAEKCFEASVNEDPTYLGAYSKLLFLYASVDVKPE